MHARSLIFALCLGAIACENDKASEGEGESSSASVLMVSPPVGGQGTTLEVELDTDYNFYSYTGAVTADFGPGITVEDLEIQDGWNAIATVTVDPGAELGARDVTVTMDGSTLTRADGFDVIAESFSIDPGSARIGESVEVTFLGKNTDWTSGVTWPTFGDDIEVYSFTVLSETLAQAELVVGTDALPGLRNVTMTEGASSLTLYDGFRVDRVGLAATFDPSEAEQGDTVEFTVVGRDTNFDATTEIGFYDAYGVNPDIVVDSITVLDAENLYGRMTLSNAASLGSRDVLITSSGAGGDEGVLIPDAFEVVGGDYDLGEVAISLSFTVVRGIDNSTGEISESVNASCVFFIPVDPACPAEAEDDASECTDGADNDEDGYIDCLDSDCSNSGVCPGPSPYDVNVTIESPGNGEVDCPNPVTVGAGDYVWLESGSNVVTLERFYDSSSGMIYYAGVGLTFDDYVPGEVYDLHTQGEEGGVEEVVLEGVQPTVPADWSLISPLLYNNFTHSRAEDFVYQWTPAQTYPDAMFIASLSGTLEATGTGGAITAIPWDDGEHTFLSSDVSLLSPGPGYFTAYSVIKGDYFGLPDSIYQTNQAKSYIYLQGYMVLE